MRIRAALLASAFVVGGCVKNISNEERLDRESPSTDVSALNFSELAQVNCADAESRLNEIRQGSRPEVERLSAYMELYKALDERTDRLDQAMRRDSDILYIPEYRPIVDAHGDCFTRTEELKTEFERFTRELVEVPTVQEVRKGKTVPVARVDYAVLRDAIETLELSDREELYTNIAAAERRVEEGDAGGTSAPRRRR